MEFNIKNTKDTTNDGVKVLLYANSSFGKTTQLGTLLGKTLILSAESGLLVLKDKDIDVIDIDSIQTLGEVYVAIVNVELVYDNVCLDSLTEIGEMIVKELEQDDYYGDPTNAFPLWKEYSKRMTSICKKFRDLKGVNVVLTSLCEPVEANGSMKYLPQIPAKKAQTKLVSLFDEVYYGTIDKDGNRVIHTKASNIFDAKSRANVADKIALSEIVNGEDAEVSLGSIINSIK